MPLFRIVRFPTFPGSRELLRGWHSLSRAERFDISFPAMFLPLALVAVLLSLFLSASSAAAEDTCVSHDQPNPIAELYPINATGVLNATIAVLPISLDLARQVIPSKYAILEHAYRDLLPQFPEGMYPLIIQGGHDHDIQLKAYNLAIPDFSKAGFEFPFLDLLGDGHTSFSWHPAQLISASNPDAIAGSEAYGTRVSPATFAPACDAYSSAAAFRANSSSSPAAAAGAAGAAAAAAGGGGCTGARASSVELAFAPEPAGAAPPYPLAFFRNVTNQPAFANGTVCDQQIRLFDTELSRAPFEPRFVRGTVAADMYPFAAGRRQAWGQREVYGVQIATPFVENNYLECASLKGYAGADIPGA